MVPFTPSLFKCFQRQRHPFYPESARSSQATVGRFTKEFLPRKPDEPWSMPAPGCRGASAAPTLQELRRADLQRLLSPRACSHDVVRRYFLRYQYLKHPLTNTRNTSSLR